MASPMPAWLLALENHATEMASGLESLVRHFDFCVTVIKHAEGGGAAAQTITGDIPVELDAHRATDTVPAEPISDDERAEMFHVLETDASEVEDVVLEIRDRLAEMTSPSESMTAHVNQLRDAHAKVSAAFHLLEEVGTRLPAYVRRSEEFRSRWGEEKQGIEQLMDELSGLGDFYGNFVTAYDGLIIEVGRRRNAQIKMETIIHDAMARVEQLVDGTRKRPGRPYPKSLTDEH